MSKEFEEGDEVEVTNQDWKGTVIEVLGSMVVIERKGGKALAFGRENVKHKEEDNDE